MKTRSVNCPKCGERYDLSGVNVKQLGRKPVVHAANHVCKNSEPNAQVSDTTNLRSEAEGGKRLIKKYETYVDNLRWHLRTNEPDKGATLVIEAQIKAYNEIIGDLHMIRNTTTEDTQQREEQKEQRTAEDEHWDKVHEFTRKNGL